MTAKDISDHIQREGLSFLRPVAGPAAPTKRCSGQNQECVPCAKTLRKCNGSVANEAPLTRVRVKADGNNCLDTEALLKQVSRRNDGTIGYEEFRDFAALVPLNACVLSYWADATKTSACFDTGTCFTSPPVDLRVAMPAAAAHAAVRWRKLAAKSAKERAAAASAMAQASPLNHLVAGTVAGGLSRTLTAPLETVRIRLATGQVPAHVSAAPAVVVPAGGAAVAVANGPNPGRVGRVMSHIVRSEGVRGLWSGNVATVLRFAPTKGIDFYSFEMFKGILARVSGRDEVTPVQAIGAGAAAGASSTLLLYPLEVVRTRMICDPSVNAQGGVAGVAASLRDVVRRSGVRGLYRGLGPTLLGIIPEAGITYGTYDLLKRKMLVAKRTRVARKRAGGKPATAMDAPDVTLAAWEGVVCGIVAALFGQTASYPLETLGRRRALGIAAAAGGGFKNAAGPRAALAAFSGLYAGWGTASVRVVPMAFLSFGTYEAMRFALQ